VKCLISYDKIFSKKKILSSQYTRPTGKIYHSFLDEMKEKLTYQHMKITMWASPASHPGFAWMMVALRPRHGGFAAMMWASPTRQMVAMRPRHGG
jgi:hypothetical protein